VKWPGSRSLIRQTIGIVVTAQILCAALLCGAAVLYERHTRLRALDISLQGHSDSLLGAIQDAEDPDDNVSIDPTELKLPENDIYAVYNQGGRLLGSSHAAPPMLIGRHADEFRDMKTGRTTYRVFQREAMRVIDRAENGGVGLKRPVTILYASSERNLWHEVLEAVRFYLLAIVFATAVTVFLVSVLLSRALAPLSELALAAAGLAPPELVFNAPASVMQVKELLPLANALTDTVGRLREAFAKEQRFVGDAAHELKTAIAVVRSSVQLLMLKRRTVEEYGTGLERVLEDNGRVEALVAQMLQLASVENTSGEGAYALELSELTATALDRLRPIAEARGVLLLLTPPPAVQVRLLPERAFVLVSNLVLNAVQHSSPGQTVSVSLTVQQRSVMLEVVDAGTGISPEALPHLFERFYREDRSRSRDTGGTGLGLSICKSIVEGVGGSISVESEPGRGTHVTVVFISA
jgi:signal transduction histidine kinase